MAKAKHRRLAAIARNKDNAFGSLVDTSISETYEEDNWVIVKKQKITILVPPLSAPNKSKTKRLRTNKVQAKSKKEVKCRPLVPIETQPCKSSQDGWEKNSALASTENAQIGEGSLVSRPYPEKKKLRQTATTKKLRTNKMKVKSKRIVNRRSLVPIETHPSKNLEDGGEKTFPLAPSEDIQIGGGTLAFRPDSAMDNLPQPATTERLDLPDQDVRESLMQPPCLDFVCEEPLPSAFEPLKPIEAPRVSDDMKQPSPPSDACDEHMFGTYTPLKTVAAPNFSESIKQPYLPLNVCHNSVGCLVRGSLQHRRMRALNLERKLQRAGGLSKWLVSQGLGQFVQIFQRKNVNKFQLVNLTMNKLKDMGADAVGPRRKLIHALDCLCQPYHF
ncbi:hypothetical protein NE237_002937 [Protea cynaroides]|uniref:SAM domain-containing protein n=1 Tax=Protea cynaroides TaxID=273540 RepID=A0A9Q0QS42_9MAGN|nr:hypothetical protein NE237_002937 [Protea cynaroides]